MPGLTRRNVVDWLTDDWLAIWDVCERSTYSYRYLADLLKGAADAGLCERKLTGYGNQLAYRRNQKSEGE